MTIIGIDPSVTALGISDGVRHEVIGSAKGAAHEDYFESLNRRAGELVDGIVTFIGKAHHPQIFIEAPMFGGHHPFEMGWLYNEMLHVLPSEFVGGCAISIVPISAVKKFAGCKGNAPKDEMKLAVYKKWGVEIPNDRGGNKADAFVLHKYGEAVLDGVVALPVIPPRGQGKGKRKKAA